MKIKLFLSAVAMMALFSCKKNNVEQVAVKTTPNTFKLADLSMLPSFATPIKTAGEIRKFTLIKADNTTLDFTLTTAAETMFGEKRSLVGSVKINNNKSEKAVMIIGKNAFELFFSSEKVSYQLQSKQVIDLGFIRPNINSDNTSKSSFLNYARQHNVDGEALLNNYNAAPVNMEINYDQVEENSTNYKLINVTKTTLAKLKAQPLTNFDNDCLPSSNNASSNRPGVNPQTLVNVSWTRDQLGIDLIYMDAGISLTGAVAALMMANISIDPSEKILAPVPMINNLGAAFLALQGANINTNQRKLDYLTAFKRTASSQDQLLALYTFLQKYVPTSINSTCAFYHNNWTVNTATGLSFYGVWSSLNPQNCFVISDAFPSTFPHLSAHTQGGRDVTNPLDVMNKIPSSTQYQHFDPDNLALLLTMYGYQAHFGTMSGNH